MFLRINSYLGQRLKNVKYLVLAPFAEIHTLNIMEVGGQHVQ